MNGFVENLLNTLGRTLIHLTAVSLCAQWQNGRVPNTEP